MSTSMFIGCPCAEQTSSAPPRISAAGSPLQTNNEDTAHIATPKPRSEAIKVTETTRDSTDAGQPTAKQAASAALALGFTSAVPGKPGVLNIMVNMEGIDPTQSDRAT